MLFEESDTSLKYLLIIHRHGHRTPLRERFPQYESSSGISLYNCNDGYGQLTDRGRILISDLGRSFREKYFSFLNFSYTENNTFLRSTNWTRTLDSINFLCKGLFPGQSEFKIHTEAEETLFPHAGDFKCSKFVEFRRHYRTVLQAQYSHILSDFRTKHNELLSGIVGHKSFHGVFDTFYCRHKHGLSFGPSITTESLDRLGSWSSFEWFYPYEFSKPFARLGIGRMIKDITNEFVKKIANPDLKLSVFSCHDSSLGSLLSTFRVNDYKWPEFGAHIVFELHQKNELWYIRMNYNHKPLKITQCRAYSINDESMCPLDKFIEICNQYIPIDYEKECEDSSLD